MANPITARLNGDDYQARHFWCHALDIIDENCGVTSVSYDCSTRKSFDDVVVTYDPPRGQAHQSQLRKHYLQIKWQAVSNQRFGYADLVKPSFVNATSISLLHRLKDAKANGKSDERFSFVTTARIKDGDPLADLVSSVDGVLRIDKLKVGKTEKSKMGAVRAFFRSALDLASDADLYRLLEGFAILDGQPNMEEMRDRVVGKARAVGIHINEEATSASDFRFDALARELIKRDFTEMTRQDIIDFLDQQGLKIAPSVSVPASAKSVLIKVFDRPATHPKKFDSDDTLSFESYFEGRHLLEGLKWSTDVAKPLDKFLLEKARLSSCLQLTIDANASIAFIAGRTLHLKSGVRTVLVQNGQRGQELWHAADGGANQGANFYVSIDDIGDGDELAVAVSLTRATDKAVRKYIEGNLPKVRSLLHCRLPGNVGQTNVLGGQHAARLADQLTDAINDIQQTSLINRTHLFVSAPNTFLFYLGQHAQALGSNQMYEFDFDGSHGGGYLPSV